MESEAIAILNELLNYEERQIEQAKSMLSILLRDLDSSPYPSMREDICSYQGDWVAHLRSLNKIKSLLNRELAFRAAEKSFTAEN
jgi:hypothetical protein